MKKIAIFILFVFTLVQVVPTVQSLFKLNNTGLVFNIDEEKSGEKADTNEKKEKKDYSSLLFVLEAVLAKTNACFHLAEKIQPSPFLENLTPPPNFC
jgi:hypothetical protein